MTNKEISNVLVTAFKSTFSIDKEFDQYDSNQQSFEKQVGLEWKDSDGKWHDAYMTVYGNIYVSSGYSSTHNPIGYGSSEEQGEGPSIDSWEFQEIEFFIDGKDVSELVNMESLYEIKKVS